jgi:hypothetical protein
METHLKTEIQGILHTNRLTFPLNITIRALDTLGQLSESEMTVSDIDTILQIIQTDSPGKLSFHVRAGDLFLYPKLTPPTAGPSRIQLPDELRGEPRINSPPTMGPLGSQYSHLPPGGASTQRLLEDFDAVFRQPMAE